MNKESPFIILHTNDIHGRVEGLSRIATIVERIRAENQDVPVLFFVLGDSEGSVKAVSSRIPEPGAGAVRGFFAALRMTR